MIEGIAPKGAVDHARGGRSIRFILRGFGKVELTRHAAL
jgi:hypothetical protein